MNHFDKIKTIFFLGIGGIGMSALARYFKNIGKEIYGYDLHTTPLTKTLESEGMIIHYKEEPQSIPINTDLVIYTPAIPKENQELNAIKKRKIPMMKRAEVLGVLSKRYYTIAIGGTHGKTSITALTTHLFTTAGIPVVAFIGGIAKNFNTNFVFNSKAKIMIVEADEYDRSFLQLNPNITLISSISADHLDIYGNINILKDTFLQFAQKTVKDGTIIIQKNLTSINITNRKIISYGIDENSAISAKNIKIKNGKFNFNLHASNNTVNLSLEVPGKHSIENALAATSIALEKGISIKTVKFGLESFKGVERRFDFRINTPEHIYIDDYAHHPDEINATLNAARMLFKGKHITVIFQPHLFSRTQDFFIEFAHALEKADSIIILPIYPAREKPIKGITSSLISENINNKNKQILNKTEVIKWIEKNKPEVLITMGAGDIGLMVNKIETILKAK